MNKDRKSYNVIVSSDNGEVRRMRCNTLAAASRLLEEEKAWESCMEAKIVHRGRVLRQEAGNFATLY